MARQYKVSILGVGKQPTDFGQPFDFEAHDKKMAELNDWLDNIVAERDSKWLLNNLLKRMKRLEAKAGPESKIISQSVNLVLTDEEIVKRCLQCGNLKMINNKLRCRKEICVYETFQ